MRRRGIHHQGHLIKLRTELNRNNVAHQHWIQRFQRWVALYTNPRSMLLRRINPGLLMIERHWRSFPMQLPEDCRYLLSCGSQSKRLGYLAMWRRINGLAARVRPTATTGVQGLESQPATPRAEVTGAVAAISWLPGMERVAPELARERCAPRRQTAAKNR